MADPAVAVPPPAGGDTDAPAPLAVATTPEAELGAGMGLLQLDYGERLSASDSLRELKGQLYDYDLEAGELAVGNRPVHVRYPARLSGEIHGDTGGVVWDGSVVLAKYLERREASASTSAATAAVVRGRRVLELGAGVGFVGMACAALGAAEVVITDLPYTHGALRAGVAASLSAWEGQEQGQRREHDSGFGGGGGGDDDAAKAATQLAPAAAAAAAPAPGAIRVCELDWFDFPSQARQAAAAAAGTAPQFEKEQQQQQQPPQRQPKQQRQQQPQQGTVEGGGDGVSPPAPAVSARMAAAAAPATTTTTTAAAAAMTGTEKGADGKEAEEAEEEGVRAARAEAADDRAAILAPFDVIVGAEVFWLDHLMVPLMDTLAALFRISPQATLYISYISRGYAYDTELRQRFHAAGLVCRLVPRAEQHPDFNLDAVKVWEFRRRPSPPRE